MHLARPVLLSVRGSRTGQPTLKITVKQNSETLFLKLEGRVTGPWAVELDRVWKELRLSVMGTRVVLDLCGVTFLDGDGMRVLRSIHQETKACFETNSPLTDYFAEQAMQDGEASETQEN